MPLLAVMFITLVIVALTLDGASVGLNALFTRRGVRWATIGCGWRLTVRSFFLAIGGVRDHGDLRSYLKPKSDLTGSGLVVGFANSSFEILAGLGVFAALGFMATASGKPVSEVAGSGIGLASSLSHRSSARPVLSDQFWECCSSSPWSSPASPQ
ncbi:sodium-dependent transporter [Cutibacterium acnes JCM 18918]|nr:sodium-dependent transporter [Cutibacterium acnes JCM 18918]